MTHEIICKNTSVHRSNFKSVRSKQTGARCLIGASRHLVRRENGRTFLRMHIQKEDRAWNVACSLIALFFCQFLCTLVTFSLDIPIFFQCRLDRAIQIPIPHCVSIHSWPPQNCLTLFYFFCFILLPHPLSAPASSHSSSKRASMAVFNSASIGSSM